MAPCEEHYAEKHVPLFTTRASEIGVTRAEPVKFSPTADGLRPSLYREAQRRRDSEAAMDEGVATPGFKAVAADLASFATGRSPVLVGRKRN